MLVDELPVPVEDSEEEARVSFKQLSGAQRFPAARPDLPLHVAERVRRIGGEDRRDLLGAASGAPGLPQDCVR
jgi:hypothetical protein